MEIIRDSFSTDSINNYFLCPSMASGQAMQGDVWYLLASAFANLVIFLLLCAVLFAIYSRVPRGCKNGIWRFLTKISKGYFIVVWIMGFLTYFVGSYVGGTGSMYNTVPMSIIYASEMFLGMSDVSAIREAQHDSALFMAWFNTSHLLAVLGSFIFLLRQFGYFLCANFKIWRKGICARLKCKVFRAKPKGEVFVFWGVNPASITLAKSIDQEWQKNRERHGVMQIVFVRTHDGKDDAAEGLDMGRIFERVKNTYESIQQFRDLDCLTIGASRRLSRFQIDEDMPSEDILKDKLELKSLTRLIASSAHAHLFLLGEDENASLNATANLLHDVTIQRSHVTIYCRARKCRTTEWLEFYDLTNYAEDTKVRIIDTSKLAIDALRNKEEDQPIRFIQVNDNATVSDKFEALIIGMGATGRDALTFLYEFCALAGPDGHRSPFAIHVIDKNMDSIRGKFLMKRPALRKYLDQQDKDHCLDLCNIDYTSDAFWEHLKTYIANLNYVVIALGNDSEELQLAMTLYQYAIRERKGDLKGFTIYLHVNSNSGELKLNNSLKFINENTQTTGGHIKPFGSIEEIFTYELIVRDTLTQQAMKFYRGYCLVSGEKKSWEERRKIKEPDYKEITNVRRKEIQDYANAMHMTTKTYLFETAISRKYPDYPLFSQSLSQFGRMNYSGVMKEAKDVSQIRFQVPEPFDEKAINDIMMNLAITEHLRWNASHEMLGYRRDDQAKASDSQRMVHNCLVEWEELDAVSQRCWDDRYKTDYKECDCQVVLTTLQLTYPDSENLH